MKLIGDFFEIEKMEANGKELMCKVRFNPEHFIYKAHFPGNPVTPGVCLVQIATEILELHYNKVFLLNTLTEIKFKERILPNDTPTFVFSTENQDNSQANIRIRIEDGDRLYAKLSLKYNVSNK